MAHWLDNEINKQNSRIGKDISISKEGLELNVRENKEIINSFMEQLGFLFDKLKTVMEDDFKFFREAVSQHGVIDCERTRFDAVNVSQPTVFMRRADIILCDKPGEVVFELYRAKREKESDPWKFHDEQIIPCQMEKLTEEVAYELIDWFAWKNYFPRGIRK
ncbi:MAG: hypothetical protein K9H64_06240 [Bacteroidales bacterium]|nr:hypothetical protein [Bacteroidales bacterium]MCF8455295.1 hypothetical protein [Bacteroidales bacterium]